MEFPQVSCFSGTVELVQGAYQCLRCLQSSKGIDKLPEQVSCFSGTVELVQGAYQCLRCLQSSCSIRFGFGKGLLQIQLIIALHIFSRFGLLYDSLLKRMLSEYQGFKNASITASATCGHSECCQSSRTSLSSGAAVFVPYSNASWVTNTFFPWQYYSISRIKKSTNLTQPSVSDAV